MDSFDNFQYDTSSSYGGIGIVDDTSSVYTANTQDGSSVDLSSLSISDSNGYPPSENGHVARTGAMEDEFDSVLDDLKDDGVVDLPTHACR
jgi:regulator of nonsense transcripts 1